MDKPRATPEQISAVMNYLYPRNVTNICRDHGLPFRGDKSNYRSVSISVVSLFRLDYLSNINVDFSRFTVLEDDNDEVDGKVHEIPVPLYRHGPRENIAEYLHYGDDSIIGSDEDKYPCHNKYHYLVLVDYDGQDISKYLSLTDNILLIFNFPYDNLNIEHYEMLLNVKHEKLRNWIEWRRDSIQEFIEKYHPGNICHCNDLMNSLGKTAGGFAREMTEMYHLHSSQFYLDMAVIISITQEEADKLNTHSYSYEESTYQKPICDIDLRTYKNGYVFDYYQYCHFS